MPQNVSSFSLPKLKIFFQSQRASVEGQSNAHLVQFIKSAKKTLDCAIYDFKQQDVLDALKRMSKKVKLRIAYDGGKKKAVTGGAKADPKPPGTEDALRKAGLLKFATAIHVSGGHLMHSKYIVRDASSVWTGSGNWTHGGLELQDNNFLAIDSVPLAAAYTTNFEDLVARDHTHPAKPKKVSARLLMARPPIKVGSDKLSLFFSGSGTEEIETAAIALIQKARKLRIIAMLISDPGILQALTAFKPAGKDIAGVLDPHEMKQVMKPPHGKSKVPASMFWFANGDKRFVAALSHAFSPNDNNDFMHNKVMIIDDHTVITGSYNFSENAESNDENMLIIHSAQVAAAYNRYFHALQAQYKKHGAPLPPV